MQVDVKRVRKRRAGELVVARDVALYREVCAGRSYADIALLFGIHLRTVYKRVDAIPNANKRVLEAQFRAEGVLKRSLVREILDRSGG